MTKRKARPNSFNGEAEPDRRRSPERIAIVQYLLENPGPHSTEQLASATGYCESTVKSRMSTARASGEVVNTAQHGQLAKWQHHTHHRSKTAPTNVASRRNPITNAGMPNGSRMYWARQMAQFNTAPRAA